jgi:4-aminobutyrate aminotransferase-like enzyme
LEVEAEPTHDHILNCTSFQSKLRFTWEQLLGSHLACAASIAVLEVIERKALMANAKK